MGGALEVFLIFLRLGLTSFGGPIAHLGYFREAFVTRRRWIEESAYADLVALCQFLPGPASSQVGFALGLKRAGLAGGIAAWLGFTLPSALLMLAAAQSLAWFETPLGQGLAHGLKLVAVAVVLHAVIGMARNLCRTWLRALIAILVCAAVLLISVAWAMPLLIAAGGLIGFAFAKAPTPQTEGLETRRSLLGPGLLLAVFFVLLFGLPLLAPFGPGPAVADAFYRSGALVFGGGHVVLPLLEAETVRRGWLSADHFLAGYGAAQAMPGPLFSFAAFVGAASFPRAPVTMGLLALVFIFLPGLLLVSAGLPLWEAVKHRPRALAFVAGANAAVVGVLAAALYRPIFVSAVGTWLDLALALTGFAALQFLKAPSWVVVLALGAAGAMLPFLGNIGL